MNQPSSGLVDLFSADPVPAQPASEGDSITSLGFSRGKYFRFCNSHLFALWFSTTSTIEHARTIHCGMLGRSNIEGYFIPNGSGVAPTSRLVLPQVTKVKINPKSALCSQNML